MRWAMPEVKYQNLPFDEAIDYFKQKINLPSERWTDLWEGMHSRGFVVAGAMKADILTDFRDAIDKAISKGTSIQEFRKDFDSIVSKNGWSYKGERGWRTGVIFNTNLTVAYAAGRYKQMTDPDVLDAFPYWRYRTMDDGRVRPEHAAWNNLILLSDDPFWQTHYPPNGWGCRCEVEVASGRDLAKLKKSGEAITKAPQDGTREWANPATGEIMDIPNGIDPGWAYNPGETAWGRDWALREAQKFDSGKWVDIDSWGAGAYKRPDQVPIDTPLASLGTIARTEKELRDSLSKSIGGSEAYFTNPAGETILVNQAIADHMLEDQKRWDGREAYFPFIPELIEKPFEVWVTFAKNEDTGQYGIRQKYIKAIQLDKKKGLLLIAETSGGKWTGFNLFSRNDIESFNSLRKGRLLWGR